MQVGLRLRGTCSEAGDLCVPPAEDRPMHALAGGKVIEQRDSLRRRFRAQRIGPLASLLLGAPGLLQRLRRLGLGLRDRAGRLRLRRADHRLGLDLRDPAVGLCLFGVLPRFRRLGRGPRDRLCRPCFGLLGAAALEVPAGDPLASIAQPAVREAQEAVAHGGCRPVVERAEPDDCRRHARPDREYAKTVAVKELEARVAFAELGPQKPNSEIVPPLVRVVKEDDAALRKLGRPALEIVAHRVVGV